MDSTTNKCYVFLREYPYEGATILAAGTDLASSSRYVLDHVFADKYAYDTLNIFVDNVLIERIEFHIPI